MKLIDKMFEKMKMKKAISNMNVNEKEELFKKGFSVEELQLSLEEIAQFDRDGMFQSTVLGLNLVPDNGYPVCNCKKCAKKNKEESIHTTEGDKTSEIK